METVFLGQKHKKIIFNKVFLDSFGEFSTLAGWECKCDVIELMVDIGEICYERLF